MATKQYGATLEVNYPYNINKFAYLPYGATYIDALKHRNITYGTVAKTLAGVKNSLVNGYPCLIGFTVYENLFDDDVTETGDIKVPEEEVAGGHAVVIIGYNDNTSRFIIRNSWGTAWSDNGYGTLPYAYFLESDLFDDVYVITNFS